MVHNITRGAMIGGLGSFVAASAMPPARAESALALVPIVPGVGYVPGDIERKLTCNTGVIESDGTLTIVDAAIPEGSQAAYRAIRATTRLPLARVIDTDYHLDHSYGNAFWYDRGAKPIAVAGLANDLRAADPELFGGGPGLWQKMSAKLPSLRSSRPLAPAYAPSGTSFGSGSRRFVLIHPGVAHTHSDAVIWLPGERVLFTGDLVANGPYNAVADSTIGAWVVALERLRALGPLHVVPGHGPAGGPELIAAQSAYFRFVTAQVEHAIESGGDVHRALPAMRARVLATPQIAHFVNDHAFAYSGFFLFADLVGKIYHERTGKLLARLSGAPRVARCCGDLARIRST